jgi:MscS family membrane protein
MIEGHEDLDNTQTTMVHFNVYGPHSLDIMIYCFTKTVVWTEYHEVREDVLVGVGEIIESHGAEIAFPTRTLKVDMAEELADEVRESILSSRRSRGGREDDRERSDAADSPSGSSTRTGKVGKRVKTDEGKDTREPRGGDIGGDSEDDA